MNSNRQSAGRRRLDDLVRFQPLVDHDKLTRPNLALELGAHEVERATLGGEHPVVVQATERERSKTVLVAKAQQLALGERDDRRRALQSLERVPDGFGERGRVVRDQRGDQLGVGGETRLRRRSRRALSRSSSAFVRLPLWPRATVRARPWWTSGCAFAQCVEPVVE